MRADLAPIEAETLKNEGSGRGLQADEVFLFERD